jgi:bifunctional ADP-heptose synthase (sugar kinase/adenylyltransferase)
MGQERDLRVNVGDQEALIRFLEGYNGEHHQLLTRKLYSRDELTGLGEVYRRHGARIAFATGTYDMVHIGHSRFLHLKGII